MADDPTSTTSTTTVAAAQKAADDNQAIAKTIKTINAQTKALTEAAAPSTALSRSDNDSLAAKVEANRAATEANRGELPYMLGGPQLMQVEHDTECDTAWHELLCQGGSPPAPEMRVSSCIRQKLEVQ